MQRASHSPRSTPKNRVWDLTERQKGKKRHPYPLRNDEVVRFAQLAAAWACPQSKKIGRMQSLFRTVIKQTGVPHSSLHSLRRAVAEALYRETHDIFFVSEYLGHADVTTTQKYLRRINLEDRRTTAEAGLAKLLGYSHTIW